MRICKGYAMTRNAPPVHGAHNNHWNVKQLSDRDTLGGGLGFPDSFESVNKGNKQVTSEETRIKFER